jgi:tetratricopeptide (TPR) repeat protein
MKTMRAALSVLLSIATTAPSFANAAPRSPAAEAGTRTDAEARFAAGVALYKQGDHAAALAEFRAAYAARPSYRVLYNIAQLEAKTGDAASALSTYRRYVLEGGAEIDARRRIEVAREIERLESLVASDTPVAAQAPAPAATPSPPAPSAPPPALAPASVPEHVATPTTAEATHASVPWAGWITTGALALTTIAGAVMTSQKVDAFDATKNRFGVTRQELDDAQATARAYTIVTGALGAATLVAAGISLYLTMPSLSSAQTANAGMPSSRAASGRIQVSVGLGRVGVRGEF